MDSLNTLLTQRHDIWRGSRQPALTTMSTGQAELDQWLPDHGWPCGQLIGLHASHIGSGELSILLPFFAIQTQRRLPIVLISPPHIPCPQALMQAGVALEHLIIIRPRNNQLWAAEQTLKSGLCGAVVVWPDTNAWSDTNMRRLQLACERGVAPLFLIEYKKQTPLSWSCAMHLGIRPGPILSWLESKTFGSVNRSNHSMTFNPIGHNSCG